MKIINKRSFIFLLIIFNLIIKPYIIWADQSEGKLPPPPDISAQSALVMELNSGRVLYEKNPHNRVYPASTTKIVTAMLAIEEKQLETMVKVSENAAGIEGSSIYLEAGEKISLEDLLYGLMLRSGNDAAIAIAEAIGNTKQGFVDMMNERARQIGAVNTHFVNPNGLYDDQHYTTAYDMALLTREAMKYQQFRHIVSTKSWVANRGEGKYNYFYNKNKVVFDYEGGNGVKIGYTKASGRTLVASSERNGMTLICVVMNAPNWFQDSYKLMDYIYETHEMTRIVPGERILKAIPVIKGDKDHVAIATHNDVLCPLLKASEQQIAIAYDVPVKIEAPVSRWQEAGKLQVFIDGKYLFSQPLYYMEDIEITVCKDK